MDDAQRDRRVRYSVGIAAVALGIALPVALKSDFGARREEERLAHSPPAAAFVTEAAYGEAVSLAESCARPLPIPRITLRSARPSTIAAADPPPGDKEWSAYRREQFSLTSYLENSAVAAKLSKLCRHQELNPRDVYIPPEKRAELRELIRPSLDKLARMLAARHAIGEKEMADMAAHHALASAHLDSTRPLRSEIIPKELKGTDMILREGSRVYFGNSDRMPGSAIAKASMQVAGNELGVLLATWFCSEGMLTEEEGRKLVLAFQR